MNYQNKNIDQSTSPDIIENMLTKLITQRNQLNIETINVQLDFDYANGLNHDHNRNRNHNHFNEFNTNHLEKQKINNISMKIQIITQDQPKSN